MCLTSTLTPVLPLRSLSVITLPIAAGFTPVLVNRSSRPHAALVSKKVRTTNRAMRGFMLYLPHVELFVLDERLQTRCCRDSEIPIPQCGRGIAITGWTFNKTRVSG